ncbi:MAG: MBL fold metallo-hydrolase [Methanosarcinales archaeon]|nr:MAG: MBL fold metallo-hydrolase [Methanosarcinales archaeon]
MDQAGTDKIILSLEKINEIIDLCIDRELYEYIDKILVLSETADSIVLKLKDDGKADFNYSFPEVPFLNISLPDKIVAPRSDLPKVIFSQEHFQKENNRLLRSWSYLFWAKRIRAELLKKNTRPWIDRYDDLTLFLEVHMPRAEDKGSFNHKDFNRTMFNFLMELSAISQGEASLGYAERARRILKEGLGLKSGDPQRASYDRWISYNKGIACQHMVERNQFALSEFNWAIKEFWKDNKDENKKTYEKDDDALEFLLNIAPATLQCASIYLKLQLGYHTLQTLADKDINEWLANLKKATECDLFKYAATHLMNRINLYKLEALLQLGYIKDAEDRLFKETYQDIFGQEKFTWSGDSTKLPTWNSEGRLAIQSQLVEHTVFWFLEKARKLSLQDEEIKNFENREMLAERLDAVRDCYWRWAEGNYDDERVYFSRWAQFLKVTVDLIKTDAKILEDTTPRDTSMSPQDIEKTLSKCNKMIIDALIDLYLSRHGMLPVVREQRKQYKNALELENFRSDDLPDVDRGLLTFYEEMNEISKNRSNGKPHILKQIVIDSFNKSSFKPNDVTDFFDLLRENHLRFLDALDEYEEQFGNNQKIKALKRCNQRIMWIDQKGSEACKSCLKAEGLNQANFQGLLKCGAVSDAVADKNILKLDSEHTFYRSDLNDRDYENIMSNAEGEFIEHLEPSSKHLPKEAALHFVGLQRWNSLTPAQGRSVGGGYFLYHTGANGIVDLGIAIDPGFDFVRNFFRNGFSLKDLDIVLISHAHPDHLWDFESIVQLLHDLDNKKRIKHQINVILTLGIYQRLQHIITNQELRQFMNPLVIDIRKEVDPGFFKNLGQVPSENNKSKEEKLKYCFKFIQKQEEEKGTDAPIWKSILPGINDSSNSNRVVEVWPTCAYHDDYSEISDSFGFKVKINFSDHDEKAFRFGYTGDTKWVGNDLYNNGCPLQNYQDDFSCINEHKDHEPLWKDVASQYNECDAVLIHVGSLIDHKSKDKNKRIFKYYSDPRKCENLIRDENHLYLMGLIRFLRSLCGNSNDKNKLILIGEFGEELRGGIRTDITKRLQYAIKGAPPILPVDVGLDILFPEKSNSDSIANNSFRFMCAICEMPHSIDHIEFYRFGHDEAIFYLCKTCLKATPSDVRQTKLQQLYEIGRELKT